MYFLGDISGAAVPAAILAWWNALKNFWPNSTTWTVPISGPIIDTDHGTLSGAWASTGGGTVTGAASGSNWAQGVGTRVTWNTGAIKFGHRVVGSTFLTSMNAIEYQVDGTLQGTTVAAIQSAGTTLIGAVVGSKPMMVYTREVLADATHVPPIDGHLGDATGVINCSVPDKVSWLRSRRT